MKEEKKQVPENTEESRIKEETARPEEISATPHVEEPRKRRGINTIDDAIYRQKERLYKKQRIPVRVLDIIIGVCLVAIVVVIVVGMLNRV